MFCIATFIVFGILAIFSASFRPLAAKAWHCVVRRITLRPCDISFGDEMKSKLVGKLIFTHPRLAFFVRRYLDWLSFAFVALSIWSLVYVLVAGLNLWVYDTCNPRSAESCSLSGEACGIEQESLGMLRAVQEGRIIEWGIGPVVRFGETVSRIPDRVRTWHPEEYLSETATYYRSYDAAKPTALEIVDPGCIYCKKLTKNVKDAGVMDAMNVSYVLYPIPNVGTGGYKFPHSYLAASYIEAAKRVPLPSSKDGTPGDWRLLEEIFAEAQNDDIDVQTILNIGVDRTGAETLLRRLLTNIGYSQNDVARIVRMASSADVQASLAEQRQIVEERVRTVKIPTFLFDGRRSDRVVDVETLRGRLEL